jgi:hypothetical protein
MRRLFWLSLGAGLGAWAVLRVQRLARQFGPRGVAGRAVGAGAALRAFAGDVRVQMRRREAELRRALDGSPMTGRPALPAGHRRAADVPDTYDLHDLHDFHDVHDTDKDGH